MKICIPTMGEGGMQEAICQHFGRAPTFTMVDLDNGVISKAADVSEHMEEPACPQRPSSQKACR